MKLRELLAETNDCSIHAETGSVQVFNWSRDPRYYRLSDFRVSSAVSGPSIILVACDKPWFDEPAHAGDEPDLGAVDYREDLHRGYPEAGR